MRIKHLPLKLFLTGVFAAAALTVKYLKINCLFRYFFGVKCPSCGLTSAVLKLMKLDFAGAFKENFTVYLVPVLYLYIIFDGRLFKNKAANGVVFWGILSVFFIKYITEVLIYVL